MSTAAAVEQDTRDAELRRPLTKREVTHITALAEKHTSIREAAAITGIPKSTIHRHFGNLFRALSRPRLELYRARRIEMLEATEGRLVSALWDDDRLGKASLNNVAYAFTQVHTARRLEAGQSTANLELHSLVETIERARGKARAATTTGRGLPPASASGDSQVPVVVDHGAQ